MENSPLAKLPAELRNTIYEIALSEKDPLVIHCYCDLEDTCSKIPGLLHTCTQLRAEASQMYYGGNTFEIAEDIGQDDGTELLLRWLDGIGESQRGWVKAVRLGDIVDSEKGVRVALRTCRDALSECGLGIDGAEVYATLKDEHCVLRWVRERKSR